MTKEEVLQAERNEFINWLGSKGLSKISIENYIYYYNKLGGPKFMNQRHVDSLLNKYKHNPIVRAFVKNYQLFILTNKDRYDGIEIDDIKSIMLSKKTGHKSFKIPQYVTEEQVKKIEGCCNSERDKIMLLLSFYCGLRLGGLLNIKANDFDWDIYDISKNNEIKKAGILKVIEKGNKERPVYVPSWLMDRTYSWIDKDTKEHVRTKSEPIFHIGKRRWEKLLEASSKKALGYRIHPHTLRHGFATHMLNKGFTIEKIKKLLGHESIVSTQIYTHINDKELEEMYNNLI